MWVHIVIFILAFGTVLISKAGWIHLDALGDKKGVRLFLTVAVCGNFLGMAVTMTGEGGTVQPDTYRIPREETGSYEKEYLISVDGEESEALKIQVPEKETEEQEEPFRKRNLLKVYDRKNFRKCWISIISKNRIRITIICLQSGRDIGWNGNIQKNIQESFWHPWDCLLPLWFC